MGHGRVLIGSSRLSSILPRENIQAALLMRLTKFLWPILIALSIGLAAQLPEARGQNQPGRAARAHVRLDVTRDAWISEVGREADGNNGGAPRLKLKSIQEMSLLDIDPTPLLGRTIRSATLHLKMAGDETAETSDGQLRRGRVG